MTIRVERLLTSLACAWALNAFVISTPLVGQETPLELALDPSLYRPKRFVVVDTLQIEVTQLPLADCKAFSWKCFDGLVLWLTSDGAPPQKGQRFYVALVDMIGLKGDVTVPDVLNGGYWIADVIAGVDSVQVEVTWKKAKHPRHGVPGPLLFVALPKPSLIEPVASTDPIEFCTISKLSGYPECMP